MKKWLWRLKDGHTHVQLGRGHTQRQQVSWEPRRKWRVSADCFLDVPARVCASASCPTENLQPKQPVFIWVTGRLGVRNRRQQAPTAGLLLRKMIFSPLSDPESDFSSEKTPSLVSDFRNRTLTRSFLVFLCLYFYSPLTQSDRIHVLI